MSAEYTHWSNPLHLRSDESCPDRTCNKTTVNSVEQFARITARHFGPLWCSFIFCQAIEEDCEATVLRILLTDSINAQKKEESCACAESTTRRVRFSVCGMSVGGGCDDNSRCMRAHVSKRRFIAYHRRCAIAGNCARICTSASRSSSATAMPSSSSREESTRPQGSTINECPYVRMPGAGSPH
jgi:hypothetical protein